MGTQLEELSGVGDSLAGKLRGEDIDTVEKLATSDPYALTKIKGIRIKRAENLIGKAEEKLDEMYVDKQWDPQNQKYYDAGPVAYECECGYRIDDENAFESHTNRCDEYGSSDCVDCGADAEYKVIDENDDEFGVCEDHIFDHIPMDELESEAPMADG